MTEPAYEVYQELFLVTEWRDSSVYRTVSQGHGWHDKATVDANQPRRTALIYAAPSDAFARENMTIRVKKGERHASQD